MSGMPADSPEVLNEQVDPHAFDIGAADVLLGILTLPLLPWVLMYAVTGSERVFATRASRMRLYAWLLVIESALVLATWWWLAR